MDAPFKPPVVPVRKKETLEYTTVSVNKDELQSVIVSFRTEKAIQRIIEEKAAELGFKSRSHLIDYLLKEAMGNIDILPDHLRMFGHSRYDSAKIANEKEKLLAKKEAKFLA